LLQFYKMLFEQKTEVGTKYDGSDVEDRTRGNDTELWVEQEI